MSFTQMHNDYLDPDRQSWSAKDLSDELTELLDFLREYDTGHWAYPPVSTWGICLTDKDADLGPSGYQGIEVVNADEANVFVRVHALATFAGRDVYLNTRPMDEKDERVYEHQREDFLNIAGAIISDLPFNVEWCDDSWVVSWASDPIPVPWRLATPDNIDYDGTAQDILVAVTAELVPWEQEISGITEVLNEVAGWNDTFGNPLKAKTDDDDPLPLGPYAYTRDEPDDPFLTDAEADADVLRSAGMGTDEDYYVHFDETY